jgi:hypothetical protein
MHKKIKRFEVPSWSWASSNCGDSCELALNGQILITKPNFGVEVTSQCGDTMLQVESRYVKLETPLSPMTAKVYGVWRFDDGEKIRTHLSMVPF